MSRPKKVSLNALAGGRLEEQFQRALRQVADNIIDPSTKAEAKRTITMKVTIAPGADREMGTINVATEVKLCPAAPHAGLIYIGMEHGEPVVTSNDTRQFDMLEDSPEPAAASTSAPVTPITRNAATV